MADKGMRDTSRASNCAYILRIKRANCVEKNTKSIHDNKLLKIFAINTFAITINKIV